MELWKKLMWTGITIIPIAAYLDLTLLFNKPINTYYWNYLFICAWEYALFWTGWYFGIKYQQATT